MKAVALLFTGTYRKRIACWLPAFGAATISCLLAGCGSGGSQGNGLSGNTAVTFVASSAANDKLIQFNMQLTGLELASKSGNTVPLFGYGLLSKPKSVEFIHLNGSGEPLFTAIVPQDIYTSATATVGGAQFSCATLTSSGLDNSTFAYGATPVSQVTVNLPSPLTVSGGNMVLSLNLQAAESATFGACSVNGSDPYSINPTFDLTPIPVAAQPTNSANGKLSALTGMLASAGESGGLLSVTAADAAPPYTSTSVGNAMWSIGTNGDTTYQGVSGASELVAGMPVEMDATMQPDGSLMATRVEVDDTNPTNLSIWTGPVEEVTASIPVLTSAAQLEQGFLFNSTYLLGGAYFSFGNATFKTSGELNNLGSLPFQATFTSSNMVAGQNIAMTLHALTLDASYPPIYIPATTVTLKPQSINGMVTGVSSDGGFSTYTVALASYDLFPQFAVLQGQTTQLNNPDTVVVYADSNTQLLNSEPVSVGSLTRFYGLVFNDSGTLKMDCAQISDGVTE